MKLRILHNSVRLRLNQTDVQTFADNGYISAFIHFGMNDLLYTLRSDENIKEVEANFENNEITITVPQNIAKKWLEPEEVGFGSKNPGDLQLLVEKDFQCLHKRPNEDESDSFPNPKTQEQDAS